MITDAKHGFSASSSGKKMNPLEKAEVSGIASGATMEGLDLALGTEEEWPPTEDVEDLADGEVEVKMDGKGRHFRIQKLTKVLQDSCAGCSDGDAKYLIQCRYHDLHPTEYGDLIYCTDCLMDNVVETEGFMCGDCEDEFASEEKNPQYYEALARKEEMLDHVDYAIKEFTKDAKEYSLNREYDMAKMKREDATDMRKLKRMIENNHFEKAWRFAFELDSAPREYAPNALWDIWDAESEPPEKDDPLESWMEDYDAEEPSAYDFVKEEMLKASPMNESEVNHFLDKLSNVPMSYLKEARSEAIKLQDESAKVILTMAINRRSFREEWASEDDYVEMMECPHCSEFGDGEIPTGVDIDSGDRWSPPTADITGWEMCEYCEGKGEVEDTPENQSIPTWDWDYLIPDEPDYDRYEDRYDDWDAEGAVFESPAGYCPECGGRMVAECQECYHTMAESFEAESNGDKQLELAVKRTKMSMIRTGLAITTFGIVLWNLWTNKKQEKQISDIMGLV